MIPQMSFNEISP